MTTILVYALVIWLVGAPLALLLGYAVTVVLYPNSELRTPTSPPEETP